MSFLSHSTQAPVRLETKTKETRKVREKRSLVLWVTKSYMYIHALSMNYSVTSLEIGFIFYYTRDLIVGLT